MTSMNYAALEKAMTICPEDAIADFRYEIGNKFLVKRSTIEKIEKKILDRKSCQIIRYFLPKEKNTVFTIDSYCINIEGQICYRLVSNGKFLGTWQCTEEDLDKDFYKVESLRFALLDE